MLRDQQVGVEVFYGGVDSAPEEFEGERASSLYFRPTMTSCWTYTLADLQSDLECEFGVHPVDQRIQISDKVIYITDVHARSSSIAQTPARSRVEFRSKALLLRAVVSVFQPNQTAHEVTDLLTLAQREAADNHGSSSSSSSTNSSQATWKLLKLPAPLVRINLYGQKSSTTAQHSRPNSEHDDVRDTKKNEIAGSSSSSTAAPFTLAQKTTVCTKFFSGQVHGARRPIPQPRWSYTYYATNPTALTPEDTVYDVCSACAATCFGLPCVLPNPHAQTNQSIYEPVSSAFNHSNHNSAAQSTRSLSDYLTLEFDRHHMCEPFTCQCSVIPQGTGHCCFWSDDNERGEGTHTQETGRRNKSSLEIPQTIPWDPDVVEFWWKERQKILSLVLNVGNDGKKPHVATPGPSGSGSDGQVEKFTNRIQRIRNKVLNLVRCFSDVVRQQQHNPTMIPVETRSLSSLSSSVREYVIPVELLVEVTEVVEALENAQMRDADALDASRWDRRYEVQQHFHKQQRDNPQQHQPATFLHSMKNIVDWLQQELLFILDDGVPPPCASCTYVASNNEETQAPSHRIEQSSRLKLSREAFVDTWEAQKAKTNNDVATSVFQGYNILPGDDKHSEGNSRSSSLGSGVGSETILYEYWRCGACGGLTRIPLYGAVESILSSLALSSTSMMTGLFFGEVLFQGADPKTGSKVTPREEEEDSHDLTTERSDRNTNTFTVWRHAGDRVVRLPTATHILFAILHTFHLDFFVRCVVSIFSKQRRRLPSSSSPTSYGPYEVRDRDVEDCWEVEVYHDGQWIPIPLEPYSRRSGYPSLIRDSSGTGTESLLVFHPYVFALSGYDVLDVTRGHVREGMMDVGGGGGQDQHGIHRSQIMSSSFPNYNQATPLQGTTAYEVLSLRTDLPEYYLSRLMFGLDYTRKSSIPVALQPWFQVRRRIEAEELAYFINNPSYEGGAARNVSHRSCTTAHREKVDDRHASKDQRATRLCEGIHAMVPQITKMFFPQYIRFVQESRAQSRRIFEGQLQQQTQNGASLNEPTLCFIGVEYASQSATVPRWGLSVSVVRTLRQQVAAAGDSNTYSSSAWAVNLHCVGSPTSNLLDASPLRSVPLSLFCAKSSDLKEDTTAGLLVAEVVGSTQVEKGSTETVLIQSKDINRPSSMNSKVDDGVRDEQPQVLFLSALGDQSPTHQSASTCSIQMHSPPPIAESLLTSTAMDELTMESVCWGTSAAHTLPTYLPALVEHHPATPDQQQKQEQLIRAQILPNFLSRGRTLQPLTPNRSPLRLGVNVILCLDPIKLFLADPRNLMSGDEKTNWGVTLNVHVTSVFSAKLDLKRAVTGHDTTNDFPLVAELEAAFFVDCLHNAQFAHFPTLANRTCRTSCLLSCPSIDPSVVGPSSGGLVPPHVALLSINVDSFGGMQMGLLSVLPPSSLGSSVSEEGREEGKRCAPLQLHAATGLVGLPIHAWPFTPLRSSCAIEVQTTFFKNLSHVEENIMTGAQEKKGEEPNRAGVVLDILVGLV